MVFPSGYTAWKGALLQGRTSPGGEIRSSPNFELVGSPQLHGEFTEIWNFDEIDNFRKYAELQWFLRERRTVPTQKPFGDAEFRIPREHAREKGAWVCGAPSTAEFHTAQRNSTLRNSTLRNSNVFIGKYCPARLSKQVGPNLQGFSTFISVIHPDRLARGPEERDPGPEGELRKRKC